MFLWIRLKQMNVNHTRDKNVEHKISSVEL